MKRTFPQQSLAATNTLQPLFSTTFNGSVAAASGTVSAVVVSSAGFNLNDVVYLSVGTVRSKFARVMGVPDGTHLQVQELTGLNLSGGISAHTSGDFIALYLPVRALYVQRVANDTNLLYLGTSDLNPGASPPVGIVASLVGVAAGNQPQEFGDNFNGGARGVDIGQFWTYGTISTVYDLSVTVD